MATERRPFGTLDAIWLAFHTLANKDTNYQRRHFVSLLLLRRVRGHRPSRGPGPPAMGAARVRHLPSRLHGRRDRATIRLS